MLRLFGVACSARDAGGRLRYRRPRRSRHCRTSRSPIITSFCSSPTASRKSRRWCISVAYNLLKAYGPDKIAIEVVAFGPGIDLLRAENPNRARVDSLISQGVQFDICMNTVDTLEREGKHVNINPKAVRVQVGVGRILALTEKGYTLVRP